MKIFKKDIQKKKTVAVVDSTVLVFSSPKELTAQLSKKYIDGKIGISEIKNMLIKHYGAISI